METKKLVALERVVDVNKDIEISVIVPVAERYDNLEKLYTAHAEELLKITNNFEFIFVIDGHMKKAYSEVRSFARTYPHVKIIKFPKKLGESNALSAGFEHAKGKYVFTLSSYIQIEPSEIKMLYETLITGEFDVVIARRSRGKDSFFNRLQSSLFHWILKLATGTEFRDISCGLRAMRRDVIAAFDVYGDLHRFIPILAEHEGFRVKELQVKQRDEDTKSRVYNMKTYIERMIDLVTLFFLLRFTYRPMRFFGLIGFILSFIGVGVNLYLIYNRLFTENFGLTDKPSLFLASLLIVIGIQVFAVGLIGEIIIYTHSRKTRSFHVKEVLE